MPNLSELLRLVPADFADTPKIYAEYSLLWLPLTSTASDQKATVNTQDDSYFLATGIKAYVTDTATPPVEVAAPQCTYLLKIASNNVQPDNNPIHIGTIVTNATKQGGEEFAYPIWIPPATTLTCLLSNLTSATAYNVRMKVCGIRFLTNYKGALR